MSPEFLFWFALAIKMAAAAGLVLAATILAERGGPFLGALVATLPLSAGPAYVFLAIDHDAQFIADSALASVAINAATPVYSAIYAKLAQRHSLLVCMAAGLGAYLTFAWFVQLHTWTLWQALALNAAVFPICIWVVRDLRHAPMPRVAIRWQDVALRAVCVALLAAAVITLSFSIGPNATGILAVFPLIFTSIMVILYRRVGGPAAAAVVAHSVIGLVGFAGALVMLHLTVVPFGRAAGLLLALAVSIVFNLGLFGMARMRKPAAPHV